MYIILAENNGMSLNKLLYRERKLFVALIKFNWNPTEGKLDPWYTQPSHGSAIQ